RPTAGRRSCRRSPGSWVKVEQRVLVAVKDAISFMKNLAKILASQTLHPSIGKPMLDGQAEPPPDRNPSCAAAEESGRRLARAVLESMDAIKPGETPQIRSRLVNRLKRAWQSRRSMAARRDLQCTTIGGLQRI